MIKYILCVLFLSLSNGLLDNDMKQVLNMSLLFYEAQRSGTLPNDNRISWRGNSFTTDQDADGNDLTGGYFTQGQSATFTFPNAASLTVLAWGFILFNHAYVSSGLEARAVEAIEWGGDHLVKCHTSKNKLYVLLGDTGHWGRPEDVKTERPSRAVTARNPGTEVAAESAAALAASSVVLAMKNSNSKHNLYLDHAVQLYEFARNFRGSYHDAVPEVTPYYRSWNGYQDELIWAALWLYRASLTRKYLEDAEDMYNRFNMADRIPTTFSWDDKTLGTQFLLYQFTSKTAYKNSIMTFCDRIGDETFKRTPKGLYAPIDGIGNVRYSSNSAFVCLAFGELLVTLSGETHNPYQNFAIKQMEYILSSTGRSFIVGWGKNYPKFIYHAGASCSVNECDWSVLNSPLPDANVLTGALVSGPLVHDEYHDIRNWTYNSVGLDHNAGFQSTIVGLLSIFNEGRQLEFDMIR